ncbi:MAG TPA: hypothetical protein VEG31_03030 [Thermoproteota archaeon]|nr:hypothetical protein [Thermoproteota archaeon]
MTELQIEQAWSEHATLSQELEQLTEKNAQISERLGKYSSRIEDAARRVSDLLTRFQKEVGELTASTSRAGESEEAHLRQELTHTVENYAEARVREAILKRNLSLLTRLKNRVEISMRSAQNASEDALKKASELGPKPSRIRNREEITKELEGTQIGLATLGSIVENAEQIYESYRKTYDDIEQKSLSVKKNKESVLGEIDETLTLWRREVTKLVDQLSDSFKEKMRSIGADGEIRFTGPEDMDQAGVQILVSFGGSRLVELNSFTQSGGERSSSIIAFMLSLQSLIQSPLRALDEFDIHMDPRNRETFFKLVEQEANNNPEASYLVVTPGQVPKTITKAVGIVVQKVSGTSVINIVENV